VHAAVSSCRSRLGRSRVSSRDSSVQCPVSCHGSRVCTVSCGMRRVDVSRDTGVWRAGGTCIGTGRHRPAPAVAVPPHRYRCRYRYRCRCRYRLPSSVLPVYSSILSCTSAWSIVIRLLGMTKIPSLRVSTCSSFARTSSPLSTLPKTVYC
jgi:hypothetical protein